MWQFTFFVFVHENERNRVMTANESYPKQLQTNINSAESQ